MVFYGLLWSCVTSCRLRSMVFYGLLWIFVICCCSVYGFLWFIMEFYGFSGISLHIAPIIFLSFCMYLASCVYGFLWYFMDLRNFSYTAFLCGFFRFSMEFYGICLFFPLFGGLSAFYRISGLCIYRFIKFSKMP